MSIWQPRKRNPSPVQLRPSKTDPGWNENPIILREYRRSGLLAHDITEIQTHQSRIEAGSHCPLQRAKIGGQWRNISTLTAKVFFDGEARDLFVPADTPTNRIERANA